ncbi:DUF2303 family protein [Hahella sp. NBU794]|uniref:DUF2303 family protein n=1 Tax=Hahella sp. NBU794 TaxID=3422590 RepID=UPI003D6E9E06
MDMTAIKHIQDTALAQHMSENLTRTSTPLVALPSGFDVRSLESHMPTRTRYRAKMSTTSIQDYQKYVAEFDVDGASCFIDTANQELSATTVFDMGTVEAPGHCDHQATLDLQHTAAFKALQAVNSSKVSQKAAAEWIEDWHDNIEAKDESGATMHIKTAINAIRRITIEATRTTEHEQGDFRTQRSAMESIEAKSKEVMPHTLIFRCIPYDGLGERAFQIRLGVSNNDKQGGVSVLFRVVQWEAEREKIAQEFKALLAEGFSGLKVRSYLGKIRS